MPVCQRIRGKKRAPCIGDLNQLISIETRSIVAPLQDLVNYDENFTGATSVFALVETVPGQVFFDGTNTDKSITHKFTIRSIADVTAQSWIKFNDEYYDIIDVEHLDERGSYITFRCNKRGPIDVEANKA